MTTPCKSFTNNISAYSDGQLTNPEQVAELEYHLKSCQACTSYLNFLKTVKAESKSPAETIPSANPYFYADLSDKIDELKEKKKSGPVVWSMAAAAVLLLAILPFLPVYESSRDNNLVATNGQKKASYLIRQLTATDLLQFWASGKAPVAGDSQRQMEFAVNQSGEPSVIIHEGQGSKPLNAFIPANQRLSEVVLQFFDSSFSSYSAEISESVVVDESGLFLVNPDIFRVQQELHEEVSKRIGTSAADNLRKEWQSALQPSINKAMTNLVINLPEKADKIHQKGSGRLYAVVPVDEMTIRSMRLAFPGVPVLRTGTMETIDTLLYAVVENSARLWEPVRNLPQLPVQSTVKVTLAEANQYLNSLRLGIPVDSLLAVKASNDPAFRKFLATHPELKQYRLNDSRAQDRFHFQVVHFGRP